MKNFQNVISTRDIYGPVVSRFILGIVIFAHGAQSLLGWFGGPGWANTMAYLTSSVELPYLVGALVIFLQFLGPVFLIFGILVRPIALATAVMFVGMIIVHIPFGFFMNWFGTQSGEGYEYHVLVLGLCGSLLLDGAGSYSVDRILIRKSAAK